MRQPLTVCVGLPYRSVLPVLSAAHDVPENGSDCQDFHAILDNLGYKTEVMICIRLGRALADTSKAGSKAMLKIMKVELSSINEREDILSAARKMVKHSTSDSVRMVKWLLREEFAKLNSYGSSAIT